MSTKEQILKAKKLLTKGKNLANKKQKYEKALPFFKDAKAILEKVVESEDKPLIVERCKKKIHFTEGHIHKFEEYMRMKKAEADGTMSRSVVMKKGGVDQNSMISALMVLDDDDGWMNDL